MLVLSRKAGEKLVINNNITVTIVAISGSKVRISIDAPEDVQILRGELACWLEEPASAPQSKPAGCKMLTPVV